MIFLLRESGLFGDEPEDVLALNLTSMISSKDASYRGLRKLAKVCKCIAKHLTDELDSDVLAELKSELEDYVARLPEDMDSFTRHLQNSMNQTMKSAYPDDFKDLEVGEVVNPSKRLSELFVHVVPFAEACEKKFRARLEF